MCRQGRASWQDPVVVVILLDQAADEEVVVVDVRLEEVVVEVEAEAELVQVVVGRQNRLPDIGHVVHHLLVQVNLYLVVNVLHAIDVHTVPNVIS